MQRNVEAERLRGLKIDQELVFSRRLHGQPTSERNSALWVPKT
jgi:hypothetical protein